MSNNTNTRPATLYSVFWLINIIYVALTWHNGWATFANVFVPYGLPYDFVVKILIPFMNSK